MALIVRKTDSAANQHQILTRVELSLPSPFKHLTLSRETVSWGRRVLMALQERFPTEHFSFTGKNIFVCNPATSQFIQGTNETAVIVMKMNDSESLEDESVWLEMQDHLRCVVEFRIKFFAQFGVSTGVELEQKIRWLRMLKGQALMAYFSKEGCDMRRKIDRAIMQMSSKNLHYAEEHRLDQYWTSNLRMKLCPHRHEKLENELVLLFIKHLSDAVKRVNKKSLSPSRNTYGARLRRALSAAAQNVHEELLCKCLSISKDTTLEWNYQILKCDLLAEPLIDYVLCKLLKPLIAKTPAEIHKIAERKKMECREEITACETALQSFNCCIDPEMIKKQLEISTSTPEIIKATLWVNQRDKEVNERRLNELRIKTPEDFLREAQEEWGYDEQEMKKALPKETSSHSKIVQAVLLVRGLKKDLPIQEEQNAFDPDIALNLEQMTNPIQYFEQQYRERDAEALALLQSKVEEVKS